MPLSRRLDLREWFMMNDPRTTTGSQILARDKRRKRGVTKKCRTCNDALEVIGRNETFEWPWRRATLPIFIGARRRGPWHWSRSCGHAGPDIPALCDRDEVSAGRVRRDLGPALVGGAGAGSLRSGRAQVGAVREAIILPCAARRPRPAAEALVLSAGADRESDR